MPPTPLRTAIYVDGLNFYHGTLRGTPYMWLDLPRCFSLALGDDYEVVKVKYFIALAPGDREDRCQQERRRQQGIYLDALRAYCPAVDIHLGDFAKVDRRGPPSPPVSGRPIVKVKAREEKRSDVNLAVHLLNDAWMHTFDCAVVVSNDSDLTEALKLARERGRRVDVMPPLLNKRRIAKQLNENADSIHWISKGVLARSQLPDTIPNTKIRKPDKW